MPRILLIASDKAGAAHLTEALDHGQFQLDQARGEAEVIRSLSRAEPDLILIAVFRPDSGVASLCERLRRISSTPLVVCSTSSRENDIVRALESGADDYLVLPIRPVEIAARLRAVLRRAGARDQASQNGSMHLVAGDIELKLDEREATRAGYRWTSHRLSSSCWLCWSARRAGRSAIRN